MGMTIIIALDFVAHAFSWTTAGPAGGWFIIGFFVGGLIVCIKSLRQFEKRQQATAALMLAISFGAILFASSIGITTAVENKAKAKALAEQQTREREALQRAQEAEENARLDQAWREGKLWQLVRIDNRTNNKITFQVLNNNGEWKDFSVRPGNYFTYWDKVRRIEVRFDYSYSNGYQEKRYTISSKPVIGHEPTKSEQAQAKINYFQVSSNGIDLFH
jgi:hypothetical protein